MSAAPLPRLAQQAAAAARLEHGKLQMAGRLERMAPSIPAPGHRPVCQAAYDELEHARRVWVRLTQGRAGTLRRTGWRHYQDLGRPYAFLPGYLHGYCARSPWRRNGVRWCHWSATPRLR